MRGVALVAGRLSTVRPDPALEQVLAWTVQYAGERQQFGRSLAKFQAIQMELAEMAGEVTAVTALTDAAVQALAAGTSAVQVGSALFRDPRAGVTLRDGLAGFLAERDLTVAGLVGAAHA